MAVPPPGPGEPPDERTYLPAQPCSAKTRALLLLLLLLSRAMATAAGAATKNVLGRLLAPCCTTPGKVTGYFRDGMCSTGPTDTGRHVVCAVVTEEFLAYTRAQGNDLQTPRPPSFAGLNPGDSWCLCAARWLEAFKAGKAPPVDLEATNEAALRIVPLEALLKHAVKREEGVAPQ